MVYIRSRPTVEQNGPSEEKIEMQIFVDCADAHCEINVYTH